jgi:hypothetical protein
VTHPFHPWHGREFVFAAVRQNWGEDRISLFDEEGVKRSLPRSWTDAADVDPFVVVAAGRSAFRVEDLVVLADLADVLRRAPRSRQLSS